MISSAALLKRVIETIANKTRPSLHAKSSSYFGINRNNEPILIKKGSAELPILCDKSTTEFQRNRKSPYITSIII